MKFLTVLICYLAINPQMLVSQDIVFTKFYDSSWTPAGKDSAFYICDFKKQQELYLCECYWKASDKLKSVSMKENMTSCSKTIGLSVKYFENSKLEEATSFDENGQLISSYSYYENGQLSDSIFYNEAGKIDSGFHYYENGKAKALYFFNKKTKAESLTAYDTTGEKITVAPYHVRAHFGKHETDWLAFIQRNLDPLVGENNNAPKRDYTVVVKFTIEKDGSIADIKAETNYGYGMEAAVINMIKKSPKWYPEIFLGAPKQTFRRQPITFVVQE